MKKMMFAVAMAIALPGAAFAQAKPAPAENAAGSMQGMNMGGMTMPAMTCKDMQSMMAKGHPMHMSKADMDKMCPESATASPQSAAADAHQGHSGH